MSTDAKKVSYADPTAEPAPSEMQPTDAAPAAAPAAATPSAAAEPMPSFPFDVVFVFNGHVPGASVFAQNFYNDLVHDGFFACFYDKHSSNGMHRYYIGIGGSDRLLHALCTTFHLSEEYQAMTVEGGLKRIYAQTSRQRIIYQIIKIRSYGGPHASFDRLKDAGLLVDHFCLHDPKEVDDILAANRSYWFFPTSDYINDIEGYFGEEFAFFIGWLRSLVVFALPLTALYVVCFAFQISEKYRSWSMVVAGFVAPCYLQLMHENWKRMEKELALQFGTLGLEYNAEVQPSYHGKPRPVRWKEDKVIERQGNENITMVVPGNFQLPIQHSFPLHRKGEHHHHKLQKVTAKSNNPFNMTVSTSYDFSDLPDNVNETFYPSWKRNLKYLVSIPTVICFTVAVVVAIYLIEIIRNYFADPQTGELSPNLSIAASVINAVAIVFLNQVYPIVARKLAEWQNFRTQQETEDAYIFKIFVFVFVNSYFPLFLNAFDLYIVRQDKLDKRKADQKVQQLFVQLLTACISTVIVSNIVDVAMPFIIGPLMEKIAAIIDSCKTSSKPAETKPTEPASPASPASPGHPDDHTHTLMDRFAGVTKTRHVFEHQIKQAECVPILPRFQGRIVLLGFAALFAAVFPLGIVFVSIDAMLVMRLEIVRYLLLMRRGVARQVDSIGNWKMCIQFIIVASVISNCLLMAFVTDALPIWFRLTDSYEHRVRWFIVVEHCMLVFVFGVEYLINDIPMSVRRIEALQAYSELSRTGRVHYDPINLHMPKSKILLELHTTAQKNDKCAVCSVAFTKHDYIRTFPCLHAIHDACLNDFIQQNALTDPLECSRAVTISEEKKQKAQQNVKRSEAVSHEVICTCPTCQYDIDCRFFDKAGALHAYLPIRSQVIDMIKKEHNRHHRAELVSAITAEHDLLKAHASHFGLHADAVFPDPGEPPEATMAAQESQKFEQVLGQNSTSESSDSDAFRDEPDEPTAREAGQ